jgi:hypothetical protein
MNRSQAELGITALVAVISCAAAAASAPVAVMAVFGVLLFAAPGYLLGQLLGCGRGALERVVVSAGLMFCVPILGGLLLYAAGVPLHRTGWLSLLAGVTLACDVTLFFRRRYGRLRSLDQQEATWHLPSRRVAAFAAAAIVALGAVGLARVGVAMQRYPGYTQLWLDRPDRNARTASIGVGNYEGKTVRYELVLSRNSRATATWILDLPNGRTWQRATQFTGLYTITAKLYRLPDLSRAYRYVVMDRNGESSS